MFKIHPLKHGESPNRILRSLGVSANYPEDIVYDEVIDAYVPKNKLNNKTQ